ncbi:MAG: hypothetical protein HKN79_04980 [Flavobacteriales bacterium]|nr:hypothetical protein [Flavobacteriales bacterium]
MQRTIYITVFRIAILTVLLALLIDTLFVQVVIPQQYEFSNVKKIKRLIEMDRNDEVPIFGSSIAKRSYIPDSIGQGYYNYGMAGSVFAMLEPLLKIELEKDKDTPILIDFEHHFFLSHEEIRFQMSNYIPHVDQPYIREMLKERGLFRYQYDIPGLRLFGQYDDYLLDLLRLRFNREYANKGGLFFKDKQKDLTLYRTRRARMIVEMKELRLLAEENPRLLTSDKRYKLELLDILLNSRPDAEYITRFESLLSTNPDRDFVLIYSPQNEIKLMGLENHDEVSELLQGLDEKWSNLHVLDYSMAGFSDGYYHDSGHMNIRGALRFSEMIRQDMERLFPEDPTLWTPQFTPQER